MNSSKAPNRWWTSRGAVLAIGALVTIVLTGICFGPFFPELFEGLILDGAIAIAWVGCATLLGGFILRRFLVWPLAASRTNSPSSESTAVRFAKPQAAKGAFGFATSAGIGLGIFSLVILGFGLSGMLRASVVVAIPIIAALVGISDRPWRGYSISRVREWFAAPVGFGALWLVVIPFLTIALVAASIMPGVLWRPFDPEPYDVMSYHLQVPREWYEAGRIVALHHNVFSFFPFNIEMHYLAAMYLRGGPWAGMYLAQMMSLCVMALTILAIYGAVAAALCATGDEADGRAASRAGTIAGTVAVTVPFVVMLGSVCYIEGGLFLYATLAGGWLLQAMARAEHRVKCFALAGAMAGFACGAKYTAIPMFFVAMPLIAGTMMLWQRKPMRDVIVGCLAFWIAGLIIFSPWLARNFMWTSGNPIFPLGMRALGAAHFNPDQVERFYRAHRPPDYKASLPMRIKSAWPEVLAAWQFGYLLVPATIAACAIGWRRFEVKFLALVVLAIAGFWLLFTHQMSRFFVPFVPFAAMAIGFALRDRWAVAAMIYVPLAAIVGLFAQIDDAHPGLADQFLKGVATGQALVQPARDGLPPELIFRLSDPRAMGELNGFKTIYDHDGKIALIGDAETFRCSLPMSRMRYNTVFDVVIPQGSNVVDGWLGEPIAKLRDEGWWVVIDRNALAWVGHSFYKIGTIPPEYDGPRDQPVVLPPTRSVGAAAGK